MKNLFRLVFAVIVMQMPLQLRAGDFFFSPRTNMYNMWARFLFLPGATAVTEEGTASLIGCAIPVNWDILKVTKNGENMDVDNGNYYGFKGKDLFRNIEFGLKFGWQPELAFIGIYGAVDYQFRKFSMTLDSDEGKVKYKVNYFKPGFGVRLNLNPVALRADGHSPYIDFCSYYNIPFNAKGKTPISEGYHSYTERFNSGLSNDVAIGYRMETDQDLGACFSLSFGWDNFDMFDVNYVDSNNIKPYENVKTSHFSIHFDLAIEF